MTNGVKKRMFHVKHPFLIGGHSGCVNGEKMKYDCRVS